MAARDDMVYTDPDTGFKMMPGSQRPDGTWRKPIRVKEGYTPQDEVPLYESKGKLIAKARETGGIPGLYIPPQSSPSNGYSYNNITNFKIDTFVLPTTPVIIPGLNTDPVPIASSSSKSKKKKKAAGSGGSNNVNSLVPLMSNASLNPPDRPPSCQPVATDPAKKLRNLRKKLRDIEALEAKLDSGEIPCPEQEQLDKVARKTDVIREISALETASA